jgi:hypothetical protein
MKNCFMGVASDRWASDLLAGFPELPRSIAQK